MIKRKKKKAVKTGRKKNCGFAVCGSNNEERFGGRKRRHGHAGLPGNRQMTMMCLHHPHPLPLQKGYFSQLLPLDLFLINEICWELLPSAQMKEVWTRFVSDDSSLRSQVSSCPQNQHRPFHIGGCLALQTL